MKNIALVLFLGIASDVAFAQQAKTSAITYDTDFLLEEFRLPGGIPGNNVNCITEGPYGFLWFGTHGGLHRYDGYEIITYGPVQGDTLGETTSLTFPYVENLYWDRFKKLWVTTYGGGLFRFDPETETFRHFKADPDDPTAIPNGQVMCATEDAKGDLWFGTEKGLCRFDRKTEIFKTYYADSTDAKSLHCDRIRNFYVDKQGVLWMGTGQVLWGPVPGGLSRYDPETDSFTNFSYVKGKGDSSYLGAVRPILEDSGGNFWVGTSDGLYKMDRQAGTFEKMPFDLHAPHAPGAGDMESVAAHTIYEDRAGGLWVGTIGATNYPSHLLRFDPSTKSTQHFPIPTSAWQVCESADGTIWVAGAGVGGKVWKLSPEALEFDLQRGGNINTAFSKSQLFKDLKVNPSYSLGISRGLAVDPATDILWLQYLLINYNASDFEAILPLLVSYDPKNGRCEFYPLHGLSDRWRDESLPGNDWRPAGMFVDKYGKIWGAYDHEQIGVYSYDPKNGDLRHFKHDPNDPNSLTSNFVVRLLQDRQGDIWAATYRAGLNRLDPATGKIKHYHFNFPGGDRPDDDFPVALMEDEDGKIWVGGGMSEWSNAFVSIVDPATDSIREFPLPQTFENSFIHTIARHPKYGWLSFVLAGQGYAEYNRTTRHFQIYNTKNGEFPFDDVASILYDRNGDLWAASRNTGDFVFWPIMEGTSSTKFLFRSNSGLSSHARQAIIGPNNGHLYFLNNEGWTEIDPSTLNVQSPSDPSKTALVDLYVQGQKQVPGKGGILSKPLWMLDEITLPNDAETFGFRFTDFNFRDANSKYQYRLHPYETVWRETNQEPVANYYKIPHGHYRFQVRAVKENGQVSEQQAELKVTILPPWWKSWWAYTIYGVLFLAAIYFFDRFQRNRIIQRERRRILEKEAAQKREIEKAYAELKAAQNQLIQSEKLASLGQLTAGIAHEIQNPLNFVNNFAEVSAELLGEMKEELQQGNTEDAIDIAADLEQNLGKIQHHGQRASSIVKNMLQHSRASTGEKEPTDLNTLVDECIRLSYHGMRAQDPAFQAKYELELDDQLPKIPVVPQDMGRVLLNLINNAFYAVNEKRKTEEDAYQPMIRVATRWVSPPSGGPGGAEIRIADNGPGIPENIREKIFQPFFTTKPTGQGTGLGLSLAYDIVVKGHGGKLEVETKEGEGTTFIVELSHG